MYSKNIDNIEDQIKAVKTTMKELEKSLEKHMQNLKTLKQYLEITVAPVQQKRGLHDKKHINAVRGSTA